MTQHQLNVTFLKQIDSNFLTVTASTALSFAKQEEERDIW